MLLAHGVLLVAGRAGPETKKAPSGVRRRGLTSKQIRCSVDQSVPPRARAAADERAESASNDEESAMSEKERIGESFSMRFAPRLSMTSRSALDSFIAAWQLSLDCRSLERGKEMTLMPRPDQSRKPVISAIALP
jgi:hypothetical protein